MRLLRGDEPDLERNAGLVATIDSDIDRVVTGFGELELLNVDDEIARKKIPFRREPDIGWKFDAGHDGSSVFIDEIHANAMGSFLNSAEDHTERDGTLGMHRGELLGDDRVEGAEQIEFAAIIGGGIAEHGNLDIHNIRRVDHLGSRVQARLTMDGVWSQSKKDCRTATTPGLHDSTSAATSDAPVSRSFRPPPTG